MKFLNYQQNGQINRGILVDQDRILNLKKIIQFVGKDVALVENDSRFFNNFFDIKPIIDAFLKKNTNIIESIPISNVKILPPVLNPSKIICLGLNYRDHAEETCTKLPPLPMLFAKAPSAIIGLDDKIQIPQVRKKMNDLPRPITFLDYEVELAIIMGRKCKSVSIEEAHEYILGYTILNDVSARMEQVADKQFFRSKSFDTFAPLGPWIVTADQIKTPMNLRIECRVNGEIMQSSNTKNMNFSIYEIISFVSEAISLLPGDIIGTGTPAGVGIAKTPPKTLKAGDFIEMTIEHVGILRNYV